ncbi:hypothetical protein [Fodinicola acaciae]|uniref:hypothetical protein n=1 Tax=Fodinicola acaciae TaxID=2681555 RepID=UPI0013D1B6CF|nr:hypothetical protein [Fodinicola acaciae]
MTFTYTATTLSAAPNAADGWSAGTIKMDNSISVIFTSGNQRESITGTLQNGTVQISRGWDPGQSSSTTGSS